jgi:hypothetical protein
MPVLSLPLNVYGEAIVQAAIAVTPARATLLRAAGHPVPQPIVVSAVIDPGAVLTCIDPSIRQALGITPSLTRLVLPAGSPQGYRTNYYRVALTVLHQSRSVPLNLEIPILTVAEMQLAHTGHRILIGCDVLARCDFHYAGRKGSFSLVY